MHVNSGSADRGHRTIREQRTISQEASRFLFSLLREFQAEVPGVWIKRNGAQALRCWWI
jgi:hypothetical protein